MNARDSYYISIAKDIISEITLALREIENNNTPANRIKEILYKMIGI